MIGVTMGGGQSIPFVKMHGLGNDFVVIDAMASTTNEIEAHFDWARMARSMCDRQRGIGADGALVIRPDNGEANCSVGIFNADGSEAEMCGNGLRCIGKYLVEHGRLKPSEDLLTIATPGGPVRLTIHQHAGTVDKVTVDMGRPRLERSMFVRSTGNSHNNAEQIINEPLDEYVAPEKLEAASRAWRERAGFDGRLNSVSIGNPHAVLFCLYVDSVPVSAIGPVLENDPVFPKGINVQFAHCRSRDSIKVRTWERGCGETQACGSGAAAACVAGVLTGRTERNVRVQLPGGELDVNWEEQSDRISITGPAAEIFSGEWPCSA